MATGVTERIAQQVSGANAAQTLVAELTQTQGAIVVLVVANATPTAAGNVNIYDHDTGDLLFPLNLLELQINGSWSTVLAIFGDLDGVGIAVGLPRGVADIRDGAAPHKGLRGGIGSRRPTRVRVEAPAVGVGITTTIHVFAERSTP